MHLGILSLGIRLVGSEDFLREPLNPRALIFFVRGYLYTVVRA